MTTTTVTGKRQVTIPAEIARKFHIEAGSRLEWREGVGKNELRIVVKQGPTENLRRIHEIGARYSVSVKDADRILEEIRNEEDTTGGESKAQRRKKCR